MKTPDHIKELTLDKQNARRHNPRNIGVIADSMHEAGFGRSILIDEDNVLIAGEGAVEAAGQVGITKLRIVDASGDEVIAVRRSNLSPQQKRRLALADNRANELSEWDPDVLAPQPPMARSMGCSTRRNSPHYSRTPTTRRRSMP